jgi:hypothetical protein
MNLLREILMDDGRWTISRSATVSLNKSPTPPEFQQSRIGNQESAIHASEGGAV